MIYIGDGVDVNSLSRRDIEEYCQSINGKMFDTSSKSGDGIEDIFQHIAESYIHKEHQPITNEKGKINPSEKGQHKSGCCS